MAASVIVRTLRREFRIVSPDAAALAALAFMAIEPAIADVRLDPIELPVEIRHGFLSLVLPGGQRVEGTASYLLSELHGLIWADLLESESDAPIVHGASVLGPWGRALLIGSKASGKTTLTLHLIACGYRVEADEHLVVRSESVIARPRTLRVKPGSLALVPSLAERVRRRPFVSAWDGMPIHSVEPSIAGIPWQIGAGRLDRLVFLEANHGGRSMVAAMPRNEAIRRLLGQSLLPRVGRAAAFGRLRHLAMTVPAFRLSLGDLDGAAARLGGLS